MRLLKPRIDNLLGALSFLTRFGRPVLSTAAGIGAAIPWFGASGLIVGCFCAAFCLLSTPLFANSPCAALAAGWLWLACEVWLSRGMHWDGVADIGDALGSGARGEKFRAILKDSRSGAFGVMTLVILMTGQAIFAAIHFHPIISFREDSTLPFLTLVLAPAWARLAPVWLARGARAYAPNSLGAIICDHVNAKIWILAWAQGSVCLILPLFFGLCPWRAAALWVSQCLLNFRLAALARKHGGLSGDFFGVQIEASQFLYLLWTSAQENLACAIIWPQIE